jgi:hypothetical protein
MHLDFETETIEVSAYRSHYKSDHGDSSLIHIITADVINCKDSANEGKNKINHFNFVFSSAVFSYEKTYINLVTAK